MARHTTNVRLQHKPSFLNWVFGAWLADRKQSPKF
jgi:hypothetical protein